LRYDDEKDRKMCRPYLERRTARLTAAVAALR